MEGSLQKTIHKFSSHNSALNKRSSSQFDPFSTTNNVKKRFVEEKDQIGDREWDFNKQKLEGSNQRSALFQQSDDDDNSRAFESQASNHYQNEKNSYSREDLILQVMNGESVASLVLTSKRDKNVKMFMMIHEMIDKLKSMEELVKEAEKEETLSIMPKFSRMKPP